MQVAFVANRGEGTMARVDGRFVRQDHEFCPQRFHNLFHRAAPQVGAADASSKECVSGEQLRSRKYNFLPVLGSVFVHFTSGLSDRTAVPSLMQCFGVSSSDM